MKDASTQTDNYDMAQPIADSSISNDTAVDHVDYSLSRSWSETSVDDPDYTGPLYHSQPCLSGIHGASYTPPGFKRVMIKRKRIRLEVESSEADQDTDRESGTDHTDKDTDYEI